MPITNEIPFSLTDENSRYCNLPLIRQDCCIVIHSKISDLKQTQYQNKHTRDKDLSLDYLSQQQTQHRPRRIGDSRVFEIWGSWFQN